MTDGSRVPILFALLAATLFGASAPLAKLLLSSVPPVMLAALLYIGAGTAIVVVRFLRGPTEREAPLARRDAPWLAGSAIAGGFLAPVLLMLGLSFTPAAAASLLLNVEAVATALLAAAFFHEGIGRRVMGAIGLITAAGTVLSYEPSGEPGLSLGALGIIGACALWGLDNNCARQVSGKDPFAIGTVKGLGAGALSFALAFSIGDPLPSPETGLAVLLLGAICYGISMVTFLLALRHLGASRTAGIFGLAPFIGAGISLLIAPGIPDWQFVIALPLMAAGALLIAREHHEHPHIHETMTHAHRHSHDEHHRHVHEDGQSAEVHAHVHTHERLEHSHPHTPDIHHRHRHLKGERRRGAPRVGGTGGEGEQGCYGVTEISTEK